MNDFRKAPAHLRGSDVTLNQLLIEKARTQGGPMQVFDTYNEQIAAARKAGVNPTITMPAADAVAFDLAALGVLDMAADGTYQPSKAKLNAAQQKNLDQYMNHLMMMQKDVCCDAVTFKENGSYKVNNGRRKIYQKALINTLTGANDLTDQMLVGTRGVWLHNKNTTAEATSRVMDANEVAATPAMVSPKAKVKGKSIFARAKEGLQALTENKMRLGKAFGLGMLFLASAVYGKIGAKDTRGDLGKHDEWKTEEVAAKPDATAGGPKKAKYPEYKYDTVAIDMKKIQYPDGTQAVTETAYTKVYKGDTIRTVETEMPFVFDDADIAALDTPDVAPVIAKTAAVNTKQSAEKAAQFTQNNDSVTNVAIVYNAPQPAQQTSEREVGATVQLVETGAGMTRKVAEPRLYVSNKTNMAVYDDGYTYSNDRAVENNFKITADEIAAVRQAQQQQKNNSFAARLKR